jgi:hypothetical protein
LECCVQGGGGIGFEGSGFHAQEMEFGIPRMLLQGLFRCLKSAVEIRAKKKGSASFGGVVWFP